MPEALKTSAPKMTLIFSTLGCNVGGLKRLPREDRELWYGHVVDQLHLLQPWHDSLLVKLEGDKAQWAYLVNCPIATGWPAALMRSFKAAFKDTGHDLRMAWKKGEPEKFQEILDVLFLTVKERDDEKQKRQEAAA